eukprot:SAG22_NODE_710_length_7741_cov_108.460089_11_plen_38_part_00
MSSALLFKGTLSFLSAPADAAGLAALGAGPSIAETCK